MLNSTYSEIFKVFIIASYEDNNFFIPFEFEISTFISEPNDESSANVDASVRLFFVL